MKKTIRINEFWCYEKDGTIKKYKDMPFDITALSLFNLLSQYIETQMENKELTNVSYKIWDCMNSFELYKLEKHKGWIKIKIWFKDKKDFGFSFDDITVEINMECKYND